MVESSSKKSSVPSRIGDYIIDYAMRSGGMGSVYRARQISMHRFVALKVIRRALLRDDPAYAARFQQEIRLLAQLEHPNVVRILEAGMDKGLLFFSMEFLDGNDLRTCLRMRKSFTEIGVLKIARQIASGLDYAYDRFQIIHRDVKPGNVMLLPSGVVKLLDLGVSRSLRDAAGKDGADAITNRDEFVGTPRYVSPEQACGADVDFHTDVYSLGVAMFELLAGVPPYDSPNSSELVRKHLHDPVPDVRKFRKDVSAATANLIRRMMAKDPLERCGTWKTLIAEFDDRIDTLKRVAKRRNSRLRRRLLTPKFKLCTTLFLLLLIAACLLWSGLAGSGSSPAFGGMEKERPKEASPHALETAFRSVRNALDSVGEAWSRWRSRNADSPSSAERSEERLRAELLELDRKSLNLELERRYGEALELWQTFLQRPEAQESREIRSRVESSIQYLVLCLERQNSGADD